MVQTSICPIRGPGSVYFFQLPANADPGCSNDDSSDWITTISVGPGLSSWFPDLAPLTPVVAGPRLWGHLLSHSCALPHSVLPNKHFFQKTKLPVCCHGIYICIIFLKLKESRETSLGSQSETKTGSQSIIGASQAITEKHIECQRATLTCVRA